MLNKLRQAVDASGEVIFMTDRNGVFTFVNRQFERLYGYSSKEVVGTSTPRVLKSGEMPPEEYATLWQQLLAGQTIGRSLINRTRAGRLVHIHATINPILDEASHVVGFLSIQRDVTALVLGQEEIDLQHSVLATEHELSLDGILVVDDDARILSFNKRFAEMWRIPDEVFGSREDSELVGSVLSLIPNPVAFTEKIRYVYEHHDAVSRDDLELTDGRVIDRYSAPMWGADGRYYGRLWYFRDVTERKRAEVALRQERDRAQRYLDIAEVILLALDLDGRVTMVNKKGCSILGWDEQLLLGRKWTDVCVAQDKQQERQECFQKLLRGRLPSHESYILTASGEQRLISWRNTLVTDADGRVVGTLSSGNDMTERASAINALYAAEERMRFALENAGVGTWDINFETGRFQWSEITEALHGLRPGAFLQTLDAFMPLVHPDDRQMVIGAIVQAKEQTADKCRVTYRVIWPDETVRWVHVVGRVHLNAAGRPTRAGGICQDLTAQKKLEIDLHHAQKLESIGRLAAGVAHEINTPIQFVGDSVRFVQDAMADLANLVSKYRSVDDLVLADLPGPARSAANEAAEAEREVDLPYLLENAPAALDRSMQGIKRVTAIVQSLKEFAHPDRTEMAAVDLNRAIQNTLIIARNEYKYVADVDTDYGDIPMVTCHGGDINQVFLNIVVNAAHAIGEKNKGTDARGRIAVQTRLDGDAVIVRISDTGGGIPEKIRHRVFEPFFTTKEVGKGTGQGLAIARSVIVEKHHGELTFETEPGHGTTFVVRLGVNEQVCAEVAA